MTSYSRGISEASVVLPEPDAPTSGDRLARLDVEGDTVEHVAIGVGARRRAGASSDATRVSAAGG